jgi:hypothetical protein
LFRKGPELNLPLHEELQKELDGLLERFERPDEEDDDEESYLDIIQWVLEHLWKHKWTKTAQVAFPDPTICYLALSNLRADGSFQDPKHVTSPLARITFAMRCMFKMNAIDSTPDEEDTAELVSEAVKDLSYWFTEGQPTPFHAIRALQHRSSALAFATPEMPQSWWVDETFQTLRFKGHKVDLALMRKLFHKTQLTMVSLWEEEVLMGLNLSVDHANLADDLANKDVGYSVITDPRNNLAASQDALLKAILASPALTARFFVNSGGSSVKWNVPALHEWLRKLAKLELMSIMSAEYLSGGPGRGTELEAMKFCNTLTRQRNFFAMGNYVCMVRMYLKTNSLTGVDKLIPSAFDGLLSSLLIQTLTLARPFATLAASICFPDQPEVAENYKTQLWMGYGAPVKTEAVSGLMKTYTGVHLGAEFGMRDWRQISTSYRRKHTPEEIDSMAEQTNANTLDALQMGHSLAVDQMHYGRTTDAFVGNEDVLPELLKRSIGWQKVCQVAPGMQVNCLKDNLQIVNLTTICNLNHR